ncbi:ATP-binding cassette domain-containing protein [Peptostreptococcaceae bacterium oral taxon 081]|nr:ATP-binding cassette domain-containing protein [Peptostreptococcaceae bacterium oral taxon 081]
MLIKISNLSVKYGTYEVLHSISLDVFEGQSICILGENSAGKSTLLKCICKLKKYMGTITYKDNIDIFYLPQDNILIDELSVKDNLKLFLKNFKSLKNSAVLEEFAIDTIFDKKVKNLSGGTKRKISLCIALMEKSDLMVLDEPFSSLDEKSRNLFLEKLKEKINLGNALIYTTHLKDTLDIATRKFYLKDGILEDGI